MSFIPVSELTAKRVPPDSFALWALGFRPFFLGAALYGALGMALWLASALRGFALPSTLGAYFWHAHEMLFGYTAAVVIGFLLTAVRNWTGIDTLRGRPLAALFLLWLLPRVLHFSGWLPAGVLAALDCGFLVLATLAVAQPLVRAGHRKSYVFILLLGLMCLADVLGYWALLDPERAILLPRAERLALYAVLGILIIMGGRVIPFFTERGLQVTLRQGPLRRLGEQGALWTLFALMAADLLWGNARAVALLALLTGLLNLLRAGCWYHPRIWQVPLVWVLHTGHAWLVLGFLLHAAASLGWLPLPTSLHGYTAGAIGVLTLGMMARVALGHTGRPLQVGRAVVASFWLINLAVLLRVVPYLLAPSHIPWWLAGSALAWIAACALFAYVYAPILWRARVDGLPG